MSIIGQAKDELRRANFGEEDSAVMIGISVFKDPRFHDGKLAYDIDAAEPRAAISFPYWPGLDSIAGPLIVPRPIDAYTGADGKQHPIVEL